MTHEFFRGALLALLAVAALDAAAAPCPITTIAPATSLPDAAVGSAYEQSFSASNSAGLPFAFAVTSGLPAAAGLSLSPQGAASAQLTGTPTEVGSYVFTLSATDAAGCSGGRVYALDVVRGSQTISFTSSPPPDAVIGDTYAVSATATSGLAVAFSIAPAAAGVCSLAGSVVTFDAAGTCVIEANQAGDANWNAAPAVQQSVPVERVEQTITFVSTPPSSAAVGGPGYAVSATASSGLTVSLSIDPSSAGVCTLAGAAVSFQAVGVCVIDADQAGDATYAPAPRVQQSVTVGPGNQTITFTSTAPSDAVVAGAAYAVSATADSGLPVTLSIAPAAASVCAISGGTVSFHGAGTCIVDANQPGDANWNPAAPAQQSFGVGRGTQTITFTSTAPADAVVAGATYEVAATASSGLPVTFSIDAAAAAVCAISGSTVSFHGAGSCVVNASQAGDADWNPAQAQQSFAVGRGAQTISFTSTPPSAAFVDGPTYAVAATSSSGLAVTFSIDASASAVCTVSGATVSFVGGGTCVVNANQAGDANWAPAPQAQQSFAVSACVTLEPGEVRHLSPGALPCVLNASGSEAEYTLVPANFSDTSQSALSLTGTGIQAVTGPPLPRPEAQEFDLAPLHDVEPDHAHGPAVAPALPLGRPHRASDLLEMPRGSVTPLVPGQLIDINAAVGGCSVAPDIRKGRVEVVTTAQWPGQPLLYAVQEVVESTLGANDWHPPVPGGYVPQDLSVITDAFVMEPPGATSNASGTLGSLARTGAMGLSRDNLGLITDIDGNGGVILFFTPKMNELSPPASSLVTQGMYQPRDMFSVATCPASNEGEILYLMVPDPTGVVNSNVRTVSFTFGNAMPTLVHHFSHLTSGWRRAYLHGAAPLEEMWLDEAIAWQMQELVFFSTSVGLGPRMNIQLSDLTTGPNASRRVAAFNTYQNPMYGHDRTWLYQLNGTNGNRRVGPLLRNPASTGTIPTVHENAAQNFSPTYTFLRYMLDRRNGGDATLLSSLVNTSASGLANLQAVFGVAPRDWARDFLVAVYADDAVAAVSPEYRLPSWNYRSVYAGLSGYPLAVDPLSDGVPLTFSLRPGGGARYARFGVAAGQAASLSLTEGGTTPNANVMTSILRTK